jgi:hypothetical protein
MLHRSAFLGASLAIAAVACSPDYNFGPLPEEGRPAEGRDAGDADHDAPDAPQDAPVNEPPLLRDCVLLLHMEEVDLQANTVVRDSSEQGNHGLARGTVKTVADGKFGRAGSFDGSGWVSVPNTKSLEASTALTYAAWIYPTGLAEAGLLSMGIVSKRLAFQQDVAYTLFLGANNQAWVDVQSARFPSRTTFTNERWYHVAVVYDGSRVEAQRIRFYVNGELDESHAAEASLAPNTQEVQIGNLPNGGNGFVGKIDEVAIWKRALDAEEVSRLYRATKALE